MSALKEFWVIQIQGTLLDSLGGAGAGGASSMGQGPWPVEQCPNLLHQAQPGQGVCRLNLASTGWVAPFAG
jgi:hypothetical protein